MQTVRPADSSTGRLEDVVTCLRDMGAEEVYRFRWLSTSDAGVREEDWFAVRGLPPAAYFRALAQLADILERDVDLVDLDADSPFTRFLLDSGEMERVG